MQKPCHGLIGRRKMHINNNVKLLTKKQNYKKLRNLFPVSGIFSPLTGNYRFLSDSGLSAYHNVGCHAEALEASCERPLRSPFECLRVTPKSNVILKIARKPRRRNCLLFVHFRQSQNRVRHWHQSILQTGYG